VRARIGGESDDNSAAPAEIKVWFPDHFRRPLDQTSPKRIKNCNRSSATQHKHHECTMKPVVGVGGLARQWTYMYGSCRMECRRVQQQHLQPLGAGCPTLDPQLHPQHLHANTTPGAHDERRPSWRAAALSLGKLPAKSHSSADKLAVHPRNPQTAEYSLASEKEK
jgi:hypothetical protein